MILRVELSTMSGCLVLYVPCCGDICYLLCSMVIGVRVPESGVCVHIAGEG